MVASVLFRPAALSMAALGLVGCVSVPPDGGFGEVAARTQALTGAALGSQNDGGRPAEVRALLQAPLTADTAVRLALLDSPRVRAAIARLGVARADFAAAVLPPVLSIDGQILKPERGGSDWLEYGLGMRLFDLLATPQRGRIAQSEFEAAKADAIEAVVASASDARRALIDYVAARQGADYFTQVQDSARAAAAASGALFDAGNIPRLQRDRDRLYAAQTTAARLDADAEVPLARERLNAVLGLTGEDAEHWTAAAALPDPGPLDLPPAAAVEQALQTNPSLAAARAHAAAAARRAGLAGPESFLGSLTLQGKRQREEGLWTHGVAGGLDLPLFDLGASTRRRADAEWREAAQKQRGLEAEIPARVRAQLTKVGLMQQAAVQRRDTVVPLTRDVYEGVTLDFNTMQAGVFQLLEARRDGLAAGREYIESLRAYWTAFSELQDLGALPRQTGARP